MSVVVIEKPWGKEELLEKNDRYMFKRLTMKKGHACSLQYHEYKTESVYLLSGRLKIFLGETQEQLEEFELEPHQVITLKPYQVHRMEALSDAVYLEASTPELEDVVRLQDRYQRQ